MVITIVQIPIPRRSDTEALDAARRSAPRFRALEGQGLLRKYYLNGEQGGGGVYVWRSRQAAEAVFDQTWMETMRETFGVEPTITWYDSLLQVDNLAGEILEPA